MQFDFKSIPKFCINLKRNKGRKAAVTKEFEKAGIKNVTFIEAVDKLDIRVPELSPKFQNTEGAGVLACAMSHIAVIKMAKEKKLPAVCIFEDDVVFCDDFNVRINYLEGLPDFDYDIISLGGHFSTKAITGYDATETQWRNVYRTLRHSGTYALIFTEDTYDYILRNWNYTMGADEFYGTYVYKNFRSYAFVPFLVGCRPGESDITGQHSDYESINWHYIQQPLPALTHKPVKPAEHRDLKDCTFIIPVRIESADRAFNFVRVIQYLCDNLDTNIIIGECDVDSKVLQLLKQINPRNCKIQHIYELSDVELFHRTRILNKMLLMVQTPVTVNYDIDVLLPVNAYFHSRDRIKEGVDLVYPFSQGTEQRQIVFPNKDLYNNENLMDEQYCTPWGSLCGHVQFFNTNSYISGGMENEEFISYGAEDRERMDRFLKMGYRVEWSPYQVYHIEHQRGINSSVQNPYFHHNDNLYNKLNEMERDEVKEYYKNVEYLQKYGKTKGLFAHLRG